MDLDTWVGQKLYGHKMEQAKRVAEEAADATMDGDIETQMELRKRYHQLREEANEALDHPWQLITAYIIYGMLAVLGFALAMYLMDLVTR